MPSRPRVMSAPDPFTMGESLREDQSNNNRCFTNIGAKLTRTRIINPGVKTLILIGAGQSNFTSVAPSVYTPTNASKLDNFNVYNGEMYEAKDPMLGTNWSSLGPGCVLLRLADLMITNGKFDRVIILPIAIGGTIVQMWTPSGILFNRITSSMNRLASIGIVPGMTGVTFAFCWGQGESDAGTGTASYVIYLNQVLSTLFATGFNGRAFINLQTWISGVTSATTRAAQSSASVITGNVKQGADADSLNATFRQADSTHFNDTGMSSLATLMYNAMVASGAPY